MFFKRGSCGSGPRVELFMLEVEVLLIWGADVDAPRPLSAGLSAEAVSVVEVDGNERPAVVPVAGIVAAEDDVAVVEGAVGNSPGFWLGADVPFAVVVTGVNKDGACDELGAAEVVVVEVPSWGNRLPVLAVVLDPVPAAVAVVLLLPNRPGAVVVAGSVGFSWKKEGVAAVVAGVA